MVRSPRRTVAGLVVATVGCLALAGTAPAQESTPQAASDTRCSEATLSGQYAVRGDGFLSSGPPPAPLVPFAVVSLMTLDGSGGLSNQVSASFNGQIRQNTVSGRYAVDADCTGTIAVTLPSPPFQLNYSLVIADAQSRIGDEFYFIETDPGSVITHTAKRIR